MNNDLISRKALLERIKEDAPRSWHENPRGGITVNYDEPLNLAGGPMPKCEIIQEGKCKV